jgi:zona occludens toxin (predicted ATPase)
MTPSHLDLATAVAAVDRSIMDIESQMARELVNMAVQQERRAVLGLASDYELAVADAYGLYRHDRLKPQPPMVRPADRVMEAVEITNRALAELPKDAGVVHAIWHERAMVALLYGSYPAMLEAHWQRMRAEPYAIMVRDGVVAMSAGESPLAEALRKFAEEDDDG